MPNLKKLLKQFKNNPQQVWYDAIDDFTKKAYKYYKVNDKEAITYYKKKIKELEGE